MLEMAMSLMMLKYEPLKDKSLVEGGRIRMRRAQRKDD
jgi:hypothetical protein